MAREDKVVEVVDAVVIYMMTNRMAWHWWWKMGVAQ